MPTKRLILRLAENPSLKLIKGFIFKLIPKEYRFSYRRCKKCGSKGLFSKKLTLGPEFLKVDK